MTISRSIISIIFVCAISVALGGCAIPRGDEEVKTEPQEGRSDGPGLFTGKKGGLVFESEVWTGPSPYGDTAE
jgi:hypothetical protein